MNPLHTFVEMEEEGEKRGVADLDELAISFEGKNLVFINLESGEETPLNDKAQMRIQHTQALRFPTYCLYAIYADMFKITKSNTADYVDIQLTFNEEQKERIREGFGEYDYAMLFTAGDFLEEVREYIRKLDYKSIDGFVEYNEVPTNEQVEIYTEPNAKIFLYKKEEFSYQNEYRIAILELSIKVPYRFKSSVIKEKGIVYKTEDLLNGKCKFRVADKSYFFEASNK
ncbi:TPA: hypothetical protein ACGXM6_004858 [Bacillus cereus]